jgi:hypothetical protein
MGTAPRRTGDDDSDGEKVGAAVGCSVEPDGVLAAGRDGGAQICSTVKAGSDWPARSV